MADNIGIKVGLSLDTTQGTKEFNDWSNRTRAQLQKNPIKVNLQIDGQAYEKKIETFIGANRELAQVTTYTNKATGEQYAQVTKTASAFEQCASAEQKLTNTNKNLSNSQQKLNTHVKQSTSLFKDFTATFLKMAKFNTINLIYDGIITKMRECIEVTNQFDSAMTEFKKVTDTSQLSLSEYSDTLGELGEATARTTTQMLEAATQFAKSGYGAEDSAKLAQVATLYQNIADAEISAGEAASFIISQMKAYKVEVDNATSILDKVNEVSNNFAVSSTDIASALTKQSASLAAYGNSLNESIALVTSGTEIMTGQAGKVARGLRTIGANITQLAQGAKEFEIQVGGATRTIKLWNDTGTDMLNTYQVLEQISDAWNDMTNAEKSSLAITLAKKTQMDTFLAVMGNFESAERAYTTALLSEGSAWQENAKYMESVEAHQAKLKAQWEQLILSAPFEDLEKTLLDVGTALLKFANSDIGQTIIKITALIGVVALGIKAFQGLQAILNGGSGFAVFINLLGQVIAGETTLTAVTSFLTTTLLANPLFWGAAAVVGIAAIVKGIDALIVSYNESIEALHEAQQAYEDAQNEIESLTEKLEQLSELQSQIEEKKVEVTDPEQLSQLKQQSDELERQKATLERQLVIAKAKADEAEREAKANAEASLTKKTKVQVQTTGYGNFEWHGTAPEVFSKEITEMQRLQAQIIENNKTLEDLKKNESENAKEIDNLTKKNSILVEQFDKMQSEATKTAEELGNVSDVLGDMSVNVGDHNESLSSLLDSFASFVGWNREATDANNNFVDSFEEEDETVKETADEMDALSEAFEKAIKPLSDIENSYSTVAKAVKEFNEQGGFSASTIKKITELDGDWLEVLNKVLAGEVNLNEASQLVAEAQKQEAISTLQAQAAQDMKNVAIGDYEALSPMAQQAIANLTSATKEEAAAAKEAAGAYLLEATALDIKNQVDPNGTGGSRRDEIYAEIDAIMSKYQGLIDNMSDWTLDFGNTSSSTAKNTKDAWKEAFEEEQRLLKHSLEMNEITEIEYYNKLKDLNEKYFGEISGKHKQYLKEYQENEEEIYKGLKSVYDKVADYLQKSIEKGYENAINALKKEEKQVLAEIKAQIDELKREKQDVLDDINEQINGLKKKKDKVLNYWNAQIDKIKESNNHLQEQNELLEKQQALQQAKAQKVMVMKGGKFELSENESAVSQAEQALSQYQDQQSYEQQIAEMEKLRDAQVKNIEDRISALEEYKDYMDRYYDEEIDALEQYYDEVQRQYEAQIEALQEQLDAFKKAAEEQKEIEEARLAAQLLGIEKESDLFEMSLSNLSGYVEKYNSLVSQLQVPSAIMNGSIGHTIVGSVANTSTGGGYSAAHMTTRASGDSSFKNDEIALVGESPNAELVLGSHLNRSVNSGKLIHLSKGSGVVNAESTSTLAGLLNGIVSPTNVSNSRSTTQTFTFGNITLPNVTDGDSFVNTLSHKFNNYAIQYSSNRK